MEYLALRRRQLIAARDEHDRRVAAEIRQAMLDRVALLNLCQRDPEARALEIERCRRDPAHFISTWLWVSEPRNRARGLPTVLPLVLRPRQVEFVRWIQQLRMDRLNGAVEKSRAEGASVVFMGYLTHGLLYEPGFVGLIGSRKQEYVDDGSMKSLLEKAREYIRRLPAWMLPEGFSWKTCTKENHVRRGESAVEELTGEAGENIGRGGRSTIAGLDEFAHQLRTGADLRIDTALSQNTECVVYISTPNGTDNLFYRIVHDGTTPVFRMHWSQNPDKNYPAEVTKLDGSGTELAYPWYELEKLKSNDPVKFAQEVDIDYAGSVANALIRSEWIQAAKQFRAGEGQTWVRRAGLDVSDGGSDSTVYCERNGPVVTLVRALRSKRVSAEVRDLAVSRGVQKVYYDANGVGAKISEALGDETRFQVVGIKNGERPSNARYEDSPLPAQQRFSNHGTELGWALRLRFLRTFEHVNGLKVHPEDELISLADLPDTADSHTLLRQLSQPVVEIAGGTEKLRINKHGSGGKRGSGGGSPDHYEALMYAFSQEKTVKRLLESDSESWSLMVG